MCVDVCLHVCLCTTLVSCPQGGLQQESDSLGLELQAGISFHVSART